MKQLKSIIVILFTSLAFGLVYPSLAFSLILALAYILLGGTFETGHPFGGVGVGMIMMIVYAGLLFAGLFLAMIANVRLNRKLDENYNVEKMSALTVIIITFLLVLAGYVWGNLIVFGLW